ncbi:hypothetical protein C0Q70_17057 [Pomacea canaliculata]|uniref:Metalloprotease TIKI homolog n=1 Tax=Pomacea canaliculata TaxID=400727 RepID=A0A2T7NRL4_POMCA|nr:hypothetical protein C0Q70_17057 [Pomacea canaliculata]
MFEKNLHPAKLNSFLWTIKRNPPSYLFGTIHVPYTQVWDFIPNNTKSAFEQTDYVFFELDLTDPYTLSALASCQLLPQGENLANVLPEGLYTRLKRHLEYVRDMMPGWMTRDQRDKGLYADYLFNAIRRQLGAEAAGVGHADGQHPDGGRCSVPRHPGPGPSPGAGG